MRYSAFTTFVVTCFVSAVFAQGTPESPWAIASPVVGGNSVPIGPLPSALNQFQDPRTPAIGAIGGNVRQQANRLTQKVDLSETIQKYAEAKRISISRARLETFMFLGLAGQTVGMPSTYDTRFKKIATDVLEVTSDEAFFQTLPAMQKCLELGKKQVVIHVHTIAIDPSETDEVNRLLTPGTVKVHYDQIPEATPVATNNHEVDGKFNSFVSSSTVTHQAVPVTIGQLSDQNLNKLKLLIRESPTASIRNAPSMAALPGQASTINCMTYRPFVVGFEATSGDPTLQSPTVQALEFGTTVRVKALPDGEQIRLMTDLAISRIAKIEEFKAPNATPTRIQIPSQQLRQVHLATKIEPGTTILIDPNYIEPVVETAQNQKKSRRRKQQQDQKILVTVRAEVVSIDEDPNSLAVNSQ